MNVPRSNYWPLSSAIPAAVLRRAGVVRTVIFDVDGVLTDGGLYFGPNGEEYKRFNTQDGHGLKLLRRADIDIALITARRAPALDARVQELGITHFYPGSENKLRAFEKICTDLACDARDCCYVGDDLVDLPVIIRCGLAIAVANASHITKATAHWTTSQPGGSGAVREVCELILHAHGRLDAAIEEYLQ